MEGSSAPRGVKGKALLCAAALSRWKRRSLGGVSDETQGRAEGYWRTVRFSLPLSFVGQTKESGNRMQEDHLRCE